LHFVERSTEVGGFDSLDDCAAVVADDIDEIAALERQQESAALGIAKIRVGEYAPAFTNTSLLPRPNVLSLT
jgi:hypothetical protein